MDLLIPTPHQHLRDWFTAERRSIIRLTQLDRWAGQPSGTFSRFLAGDLKVPLKKTLHRYYPILALLAYMPPKRD